MAGSAPEIQAYHRRISVDVSSALTYVGNAYVTRGDRAAFDLRGAGLFEGTPHLLPAVAGTHARGGASAVADGMSIARGVASAQMQAAQAARLSSSATPANQALSAVPGLALVAVPPRNPNEPLIRPKRSAHPMHPPREQRGGASPLATVSVRAALTGAEQMQDHGRDAVEEHASHQSRAGLDQLPARSGLIAYARTHAGTGSLVYLEADRWHNHIRTHHITDSPTARGKRTTTWWPVQHAATGVASMNETQVVGVIMDAVRNGHWQNAPRGTVLSVYELPQDQAQHFGVSEVKVSAAPDGRILSAYPSRGSNVLAVREMPEHAPASDTNTSPASGDRLFATRIPGTTFG